MANKEENILLSLLTGGSCAIIQKWPAPFIALIQIALGGFLAGMTANAFLEFSERDFRVPYSFATKIFLWVFISFKLFNFIRRSRTVVSRVRSEAGSDSLYSGAGYIYVLTNASLARDMFKVGSTSRHPEERALELSAATGVATPYLVIKKWKVHQPEVAERVVHKSIDQFRVNRRREFFCAPFEQLYEAVDSAVRPFLIRPGG